MNEQAIQDSYNAFVAEGYSKSFDEYKKLINTNPNALNDSYKAFVSQGYGKSINDYRTLMGIGSQESAIVKKKITTELPLQDGSSVSQKATKIPETTQKNIEEEDYFTGSFGNVLRGFDEAVPLGIGDFVDDMARSVASGYRQGTVAEAADKLLLKGHKSTPEQIQKFIDANKSAQKLAPSAEMQDYNKTYEKEGKGFWGVVKGLANNPSVIPEVLASSLVSMATNTHALTAGGAAIGSGATYGATAGAVATPEFLGAGAIPGAIAGATSAVPYAFGLASTVVEAGSTFGELLTEELNGKQLTKENVKAILEDSNKLQSIRNKAIARGVIIGTVDALTGKLASGVGAKIISKSAAKSAAGIAAKSAVVKSTAIGSAIESVGGSAGEAAARLAVGQDMDVSEIALEGLGELPGGVRSTIQARLVKPSYKINGSNVKADELDELIDTMTPNQLSSTKIEIKNDYEGREFKIRDKILTHSVKEEVKKANPSLNEPSLNAITDLEKSLKSLEGNSTQTGKDKAALLKQQIKDIQENQLEDEVVVQATETIESPEKVAARTERISELENILSPEADTQVPVKEKIELEKELETLKTEQDAIQEQTTDESVLRTEQPEMGLQGVGEGNVQPQATSTEETITNAKPEVIVPDSLRQEYDERLEQYEESIADAKEYLEKQKAKNFFLRNKSEIKSSEESLKYYEDKAKLLRENPVEFYKQYLDEQKGYYEERLDEDPDFKQAQIDDYGTTDFDVIYSDFIKDTNQKISDYENAGVKPSQEVEDTANFLWNIQQSRSTNSEEVNNIYNSLIGTVPFIGSNADSISQAYYKAKEDGSNPELVEKVEKLVSLKTPTSTTQTQVNETKTTTNEVQPEPTGNGGRRTDSGEITPLEGAPTIQGATGPNPQLVAVAEKYAADNGIDLKRQGEYVEVDEERAKRIADTYEEMVHDPQNPKVKEAYAELIKQTIAQYQALVDAGYKFWFMDLNEPSNVKYAESPYNAMRDLRQNKQMGVFPTTDGFGTDETLDVSDNPLLADTGIKWAVGGLDGEMKPVLANDLFRAVHDAFGHGLEGAGFRVRGEENAWQAHSRLYTGDAVGAMTSETRGQNSWVNYGPKGEQNRVASAEYTEFADQKVGLMPEWTWTEGRASDMGVEQEVSEELGTQGLSEAELPGYDRMMTEVEGIVKKTKERLSRESVTDAVKKKRLLDAVMGYVTGPRNAVYNKATDVQRERLVRDVRKRFGFSERSAPSVGRLFGTIKNVTKITMTEKAALVKQIKDLGRGAKDAVKAWKIASQELSKQIKELKASGKITSDQAANVIRAFSKVNVFSQKSVDRFTQYMTNVFEKADYANKLNKAKETRRQIKKLSRNKDKNANLRDLASKFSKIDPSIVTDIDKYNALAAQIKSATDGSKIRGQKIKWSEVVNIADATDYINQEIEAQDKILKEEKTAELEELLGEDAAIIDSLLELDPDQDISKEDAETVKDIIKKVFDAYSNAIKNSLVSDVDSFTGEDILFTKKEKETITKFMNMDLDKMSDKNALQAVDALANFIENKSTAKMGATIAAYTGNANAEIVANKGIYAIPLKKLFSPQFGAFLAEQTTTLPMVFEKMFKGFNRGGAVMDAMGLTKLINRKSFAETQANNIVADYIKVFYNSKSKPNGQAFNTAYNNIERGMSAFMLRNVIGTEAQMQTEFDRRKGLVKESIDVLSEGNKLQQKKAELYKKAYDKIVIDSENIQDIKDKTDPKNLEAVDFWHKQWESKFDQMSDVASGIYNKILDKDLNYSPDKFSKLKSGKEVDLLNSDSAFINNTDGVLYKKKTGVLEDVNHPSKLPTSNDKTTSYIDLSFDKNNSNSMYDALVDIETAEPIRQVQAFLNSDSYSKIVPDSDNADMLAKRIDTYVQNIRGKNPFSNDEFSKAMRALNKMATLGVGQALGGVTQPIKQVVPVALNTLINGQGLALGASFDADFISWLNSTGYSIANRGIQSQGAIDSLNKILDEAANSKGQKMFELIEKANALLLKTFLEKPDVFIAKASWKTYYEKSLKKQGIDSSNIDYSDHDVNEDAANYAQRMVDRQQNISDQDLAGNLFTDKNAKSQVLRNIFMPFASFRMNQASRLATDLSVLGHWSVSTVEDKKIALLSLSSFATEMAMFKLLSAGIGIALSSAAVAWVGKDESDEEEEKRKNNIYKGQATGAITDVLSPLPIFDKMIQTGAAAFLSGVQEGLDVTEEDKLALFSAKPEGYLKNLGLYGMAADRLLELGKLIDLSVTGEYTDDFGKQKTISDESKDALSTMIGPALLTNIGLGPSELAGIIRNSVKISKKKGKKISKEEIKKSNPKLYEKLYGKNSSDSRIKDREDRMKDRLKERESRLDKK